MKKLVCSILLVTLACTLSYAQDGNYTENRSVGSFNAIDACCGVDVYITEGASSTVKVETNKKEYLSNIITETKNGELKISVNNNNFFKGVRNLKAKVYVTANNLTSIKSSAGSDVYSNGTLQANDIKLLATSGSDINIELNAVNIEGKVTSGSDIKVKGKASYASLSATSGSDMNLQDMTINVVDASASSGSDIVVTVVDEINAKASSGGDVIYKGNPKTVNKKQSSGGGIKQRS